MLEFIKLYGWEVLGTVSSLVYLYYSIRESAWLWPWGIIASFVSIQVFFSARLYADMSLQFYYLVISIYGWWYWSESKSTDKQHVAIKQVHSLLALKLIGVTVVVYLALLLPLLYVPALLDIASSDMPFLDAFTTAASIVATWMLARKYIEHWLIWIVVNSVSMVMYLAKAQRYVDSKGLYLYSFLFLIYTIGAYVGYRAWKKST